MQDVNLNPNEVRRSYQIWIYAQYTTLTTNQCTNLLAQFDWSKLPQSRYRVSFVGGQATANNTTGRVGQVYIDLGQTSNYMAGGSNFERTTGGAYNGNMYVATHNGWTNYGANSTIKTPWTDCVPIYLDSLPAKNVFEIKVLDNINQSFLLPTMSQSMVCLAFEELDYVPRRIRDVYNVVFNSLNGTPNTPTIPVQYMSTTRYYFDWAQLPEGKYSVLMSFNMNYDANNLVSYTQHSLYTNLGQTGIHLARNQSNAMQSAKSTMFAPLLSLIGTGINEGGDNGMLYANYSDNPPVFLENRPPDNNVDIEIITWYSGQFLWQMGTNSPIDNYTCTFSFRWLGE